MGAGYHLSLFRAASPVTVPAGVLFVLAGLLFTWAALRGTLAAAPVPGWLLAVPVAWALFGASAALLLGVGEDALLPVAAALGTAGVLSRNRASRRATSAAPGAAR